MIHWKARRTSRPGPRSSIDGGTRGTNIYTPRALGTSSIPKRTTPRKCARITVETRISFPNDAAPYDAAPYDACVGGSRAGAKYLCVLLRVQVANSLFFFLQAASTLALDGRNLLLSLWLLSKTDRVVWGVYCSGQVRPFTRNIAIARITVHRRPTTRARGAAGL